MNISDIIKKLLTKMTGMELSAKTGISGARISRWKDGKNTKIANDALKLADMAKKVK